MDGEWQQYPDTTIREMYPPSPTRGGNVNAEAKESVIAVVANRHAGAVRQEAAFREQQRQRRLRTRGAAAMREPEESLSPPPLEVPDDPALDEYKQAGWL